MKKSTKVALTLLVPAMTAYGCGNQPKTVQVPANAAISNLQNSVTIQMKCPCGHSFSASGDRAGATVQCPNCNRTLSVHADGAQASRHTSAYTAPYSHRYRSNSSYRGWFGGDSTHSSSPPPIASANHTTGTSHAPNVSHVSSSGFGGTGAHFSGGS